MSTSFSPLIAFCIALYAVESSLQHGTVHSEDALLHSQLTSYELLEPIRFVTKRSADQSNQAVKHVSFRAFNKQYQLVLSPSTRHLALQQSLKITLIPNDTRGPIDLNPADVLTDFFCGHLQDDEDSHVSGYKHEEQLHLTVYLGHSDVLNVEPLSLITGNLSDRRLLAFYDSSIMESQYRCGVASDSTDDNRTLLTPKSEGAPSQPLPSQKKRRSTTKTMTPVLNSCAMHIVADHMFVNHVRSAQLAYKFMIKAIDDINEIFLGTEFVANDGMTYRGIGLHVARLTAFNSPTEAQLPMHFNTAPIGNALSSSSNVLESFGDERQNGLQLRWQLCLGHLVTYRRFAEKVLGLAYPGSRDSSRGAGGICSPSSMSRNRTNAIIARNIALTTFRSSDGTSILTRQGVLVMAHEVSHNFGSRHDPKSGECSPTSDGSYLLNEKAVTGMKPNHNKLSPCSRRAMGDVIQGRLNTCLISNVSAGICGNLRLDPGEQCDAGVHGDDCCGPNCLLRPSAACSDVNAPCCQKCALMSPGIICRKGGPPLWPCREDAVCSGQSPLCPEFGPPVMDGAACLDGRGLCRAGSCLSVCVEHGLTDCLCPMVQDACRLCCSGGPHRIGCSQYRVSNNGSLLSAGSIDIRRPGCVITEEAGGLAGGLMARLWRLVWRAESGVVVAALRDNMAFIVVVLSLLIWPPTCTVIEYYHRRRATNSAYTDQAYINT